jgi:cytoskeletal protein CcmA (bactofilin family)
MEMFTNRGKRVREPVDYSILLPDRDAAEEEDYEEVEEVKTPPETVNIQPQPSARNGREARPTAPDKCTTVLSVDSVWAGSIDVGESIRIEGRLSGEIKAEHTVHISEGAEVDAKVEAAYVVVLGSFTGQIRCRERLELLPKSRIKGSITTKLLTVHEGAFIDGEIHMTGSEQHASSGRSSRPNVAANRGQVEVVSPATESAESRDAISS